MLGRDRSTAGEHGQRRRDVRELRLHVVVEARELIDADTEEAALELLPHYVAERTTVSRVGEVEIA